jgi:Protein of unknown function (DUF3703)
MVALAREHANRLIAEEMIAFRAARASNDGAAAWQALEHAHIISQPFLGPHLASHWEMLGFALAEREAKEAVGQLIRLLLAPLGALTGKIPIGNTGRSNVSAFRPMPITPDLKKRMDVI